MTTKEYMQKMRDCGFKLYRVKNDERVNIYATYFSKDTDSKIDVRVREDKAFDIAYSCSSNSVEETQRLAEITLNIAANYASTPVLHRSDENVN